MYDLTDLLLPNLGSEAVMIIAAYEAQPLH